MREKAKQWAARIEEWKRSGVSQRQYCEDSQLSRGTFGWWRNRLKNDFVGDTSFVEIPTESTQDAKVSGSGQVCITMGSYTITLSGAVDEQQLETVLSVLERR